MIINITATHTGTEVISGLINSLAASAQKINAKPEEIKAQVINKDGAWVDFSADKIRFVYSN